MIDGDVDGIAFRADGPDGAPALLLLHSLGHESAMWAPQVPRWSATHRVVRMDFRGHGASHAPDGPYTVEALADDAVAVLDHLDVPRAAVCGLSMGGQVALQLALAHPARVTNLIACATAAKIGSAEGWEARRAAIAEGGLARIADDVMRRFFSEAFRERRPDVVAEARASLLRCSAEGYRSCCAALAAADLTDRLGAIEAPTLLLAGEADVSTPVACLEQLSAAIRQAQLEVVPGAGHLLNLESPERVAALVASALQS